MKHLMQREPDGHTRGLETPPLHYVKPSSTLIKAGKMRTASHPAAKQRCTVAQPDASNNVSLVGVAKDLNVMVCFG
jgi:hypothetical protein